MQGGSLGARLYVQPCRSFFSPKQSCLAWKCSPASEFWVSSSAQRARVVLSRVKLQYALKMVVGIKTEVNQT